LKTANVTMSFTYPEGFDGVWDVPHGEINVAHDIIVVGMRELALNTLVRSIQLNKSEVLADRLHAKYLEVLVEIMNSVEVSSTY